ncbi:hypothetical protein [Roseateles amylovorans]|uniref:Serine/threonine protein kinase n=1 Tax=Roseateles amylovorans TaxID=2978473 RepID=A0ABY6B2B1_9BURK|nr:hypothetical protein [Roseateles amylovorans]UXH78834.1 hypothetical protein N4261_02520 [Roseateles amylovorans]
MGERLGVWRITEALFECASGQWFRVEHALAAGQRGMALVYRHESDAQAVLMRFAEDSDALSRFHEPTYGAPLDSGLTPSGLPYLIVPAMEGAPLMRVAMALPLRRRMQLLLDLVGVLDAAQSQGLILHELDPGTLWLSPTQQLHWLGQGLAPRVSEAPTAQVRAALPLADARQRAGARPDAASEAHALGRLLGLLVNGRLPRSDAGLDGLTTDEADSSATPVASLQSWMSLTAAQRETLDQLLDRAMVDGRTFTDRAPLAAAVEQWLEAASIAPAPATRNSASVSTGQTSTPLVAEEKPVASGEASIAQRLGIVIVMAVIALVVWALMRWR